MEIFKGVRILPGLDADSNIYIIDNEVLIDTGTGEYFHSNRKDIEGVMDPKRLKLIVNTHYHFDHCGGNKKFRDWLHIPIAAHPADKELIESGQTLAESFGKTSKIVTVDVGLIDGDVIRTENFRLQVLHTPGHSSGSICLFEPEKKILISGDTLFDKRIFGRTDLPTSEPLMLMQSIIKLSRKCEYEHLCPGHDY